MKQDTGFTDSKILMVFCLYNLQQQPYSKKVPGSKARRHSSSLPMLVQHVMPPFTLGAHCMGWSCMPAACKLQVGVWSPDSSFVGPIICWFHEVYGKNV
eukprot:1155836-Pelagomonas_calceolata.AAC.2